MIQVTLLDFRYSQSVMHDSEDVETSRCSPTAADAAADAMCSFIVVVEEEVVEVDLPVMMMM